MRVDDSSKIDQKTSGNFDLNIQIRDKRAAEPKNQTDVHDHFGDTQTDPSAKMMADVFSLLKSNATKTPAVELSNHGQIDKMDIPGGWKGGPDSLDLSPQNHELQQSSYFEYHPPNAPDAQLGFYYRGHRTSETAGKNFQDVLSKPGHELSKEELSSLSEIIGDKANPKDFNTSSAKTEDLNGKRVLVLEGQYTANQQEAKHIYVDSDNTGTAVQEIFFQAPVDKYKAYEDKVKGAIDSIKWTC